MTMLTEARKRGGAFVRGDVLSLPIPIAARVLGGVRTDRVLQHVADPDSALDELARVLRRGGVVVLAEPDQSTLVIEGTDSELTPAIMRFRAQSLHNGYLAGDLAARLAALGFVDISTESFAIELNDPALAFGLLSWPAMLVERSVWIADEAQRFTDSLGSEAFRYTVDVVVTRGTR